MAKTDPYQQMGQGQMYFALGSVGWGLDSNYYDLGNSSNGGRTLVKVQLVWGRPPTTPIDTTSGRSQGVQILAQLLGPLYAIPPQFAVVAIGMPSKMWRKPGACVIVGWAMPSPAAGFDVNNMQVPVPDGQNLLLGDANAIYVALSQKVDNLFGIVGNAFNGHAHPSNGSPPTANPGLKIPLWDGASGAPPSTAAKKIKAT